MVGLFQKYIEALKAEFSKQRQDFQIHGIIFSYLIKPIWLDLTTAFLDVF